MARRVSVILLSLLSVFLLGTIIVLSTTKAYLKIDEWAYIKESELSATESNTTRSDELIPRILHQTWKTENIPERWQAPSQHCRDLMPDFKYMLWTDASSRQLIVDDYPWFLSTFDGYKYNIQRADAIRYFVLHKYGGVYMDLDMGCKRPIDSLLKFQVILAKTIPVGVSNDLLFSAKAHPFMEQVIRGLITFDINYILNYPTVMFSTGPMFMSVQYGLYTKSHPPTSQNPGGDVRVLPKSLYGKNAKPGEAPNSFFEHFYGSSWHSDDAWLWTFLGLWGIRLMNVAIIFALVIGIKMYWFKKKNISSSGFRSSRRYMLGRYEVILPRFHFDRGNGAGPQLDLGSMSIFVPSHSREVSSFSSTMSPLMSEPSTSSPTDSPHLGSTGFSGDHSENMSIGNALRRAGAWMMSSTSDNKKRSYKPRRRRSKGILFYLPAIFHPTSPSSNPPEELESFAIPYLESDPESQARSRLGSLSRSRSPVNDTDEALLEAVPLMGANLEPPSLSTSRRSSMGDVVPPPYASSRKAL